MDKIAENEEDEFYSEPAKKQSEMYHAGSFSMIDDEYGWMKEEEEYFNEGM
ncbi:hypothetical protein [Alteribacillus bidgolensis]|uniref:hypothetical protein n=1 Tax=Alteribacillus bidgolensis TaxID=930129 RepID=UPI0014763279|nr:hypothetical protein [Alteribacillus bidgolensis]